MRKKYSIRLLIILCTLSLQNLSAQMIDNTSTFKTVHQKSYFRILYDNDFLVKMDYYYTQGFTLEYVHPALKKFPLAKLLIKIPGTISQTGITLNTIGYTPVNTDSDDIPYGDRPFAGIIDLKTFSILSDSIRSRRIVSAFTVGVIGPAALGKQMQTEIHRWFHNTLPRGWEYQIQNDIILNYQVNYEKKLLGAGDNFLLNATGEARLGTLSDKISGGFNFMAGNFNNPYHPGKLTKKIQCYLFGQARASLIGYDATMQGGLINRSSPYTISSGDISRVTFEADGGVMLNFKKLYFAYTQSFITKEFRTGLYHRWGGLSAGFTF